MNKKIVVCFMIFVIFICTFSTNSSATYDLTLGDLNLSLPDECENYEYKLFFYRIWDIGANGWYRFSYDFYFSNSEMTFTDYSYKDDFVIYSDTPIYYSSALSSVTLPAPYSYNVSSSSFGTCSYDSSVSSYAVYSNLSGVSVYDDSVSVYNNFDLKNRNTGKLVFNSNGFEPPFENPSFGNTAEELSSLNFDFLKILPGSFGEGDSFQFNIFRVYFDDNNNVSDYTKIKGFIINDPFGNSYIPKSDLGLDYQNGNSYIFQLSNVDYFCVPPLTDEPYCSLAFTIGGLTDSDIIQNNQNDTNDKLDEQTNAIKESNETNKGIWETIKDILSYINPFSENFFVYKLIDLLINALKSLFIPSNDFLSTYFTNLKNWFSDRLGFLFYPFELIIDVLNKMLNIDFSNPVFNIPNISEPFTGQKLISATTYNLNSLLDTEVFKTIHDIYLVIVDAFIIFGLVNLFRKKWEEVTNK